VTVVSRSTVLSTVLPSSSLPYQQTRLTNQSLSVSAKVGAVPPQATVRAGSPYAAFCSGPAVTGRCGRSRIADGSWESRARQTVAGRSARAGAAISTGVVDCGVGAVADELGSDSG